MCGRIEVEKELTVNRTITVYFGGESRITTVYRKKNGKSVYWSPFNGERIEFSVSGFTPSTDGPEPTPMQKGKMWMRIEMTKLERRLELSKRCPEVRRNNV